MKEKRLLRGVCLYAISMLILFVFCVLFASKREVNFVDSQAETTSKNETVYVYVEITSEEKETAEVIARNYYKVCAYEERIAVFSEDGTLLEVWDTYVKTLPKADQRLLEEGLILFSEEEFHAVKEDYTS